MAGRIWIALIFLALLVPAMAQEQLGEPEKFERHKTPDKSPEALVEQLGSGDWRTRELAQEELLAWGEKARGALEAALEHEAFEVRYRAGMVAEAIGSKARAMELLGYLSDEKDTAEVLAQIGKKVKRPIPRLTSLRASVRAELARELGDCGIEAALPLIVHLLGDEDQGVQNEALRSLGIYSGQKRRGLLLKAAEKGALVLRCRSILALGKLQDTEAVDEVAKYLESDLLYERLAAVESLDAMRNAKALERLVKAFKDEYERPRWNAVDAFTRVKCKAGVEHLIGSLGEDVARLMDEDELATIKKVLVPAGFSILKGEEAQMRKYVPQALMYQTGMNFGEDADKWSEWWEKNKELFDNEMKKLESKAKGAR